MITCPGASDALYLPTSPVTRHLQQAIVASPHDRSIVSARTGWKLRLGVATLLAMVTTLSRADDALALRIQTVSAKYLGAAYLLDPLGEGPQGAVDRDPLVRFDRFDCQTYVETVLAEARSSTPAEFAAELRALRYRDGEVDFASRNHFPDVDWIPNNLARGVLVELTSKVAGPHGLEIARATITRKSWFLSLADNPTQLRNSYLRTHPAAQAELRRIAASAPDAQSVVRYIPRQALSDPAVLARIPSASIVFIVRPHISMFGAVGSVQNIAHFGFAIRDGARLLYRHASSTRARAVIDVPLAQYIERAAETRTFAGIAVYGVR
jgi:hypothetical protein